MPHYTSILCPTDLSPESDSALGHAASLAVTSGAKLVLAYCNTADLGARYTTASEGLFEESVALNVPPDLLGRLSWEGVVLVGRNAGEAIAAEAAARGIDLIVMRSRRRPLGAALLGSTAEALSRLAPCPMLVTHPHERAWDRDRNGTLRPRRILVGYDFWDDSEIALQHALAFAAQHGSELHILHSISPHAQGASDLASTSRSEFHHLMGRLERAVPQALNLGVRFVPHVVTGHPYRELLTFAEENDVDFICIGARGRDFGSRSLFGSNSDRIMRQAPCPVLIARPLRPASQTSYDRAVGIGVQPATMKGSVAHWHGPFRELER
jgi:nucleotide-binding universal stress UspA family protein